MLGGVSAILVLFVRYKAGILGWQLVQNAKRL